MIFAPFLPTPFTDAFAFIAPYYKHGMRDELCAKLEMKFITCVECYGSQKAPEKCLNLFYDVFECTQGKIQQLRVQEIRKERMKQYKAGKIKELESEKPPLESYFHIFW